MSQNALKFEEFLKAKNIKLEKTTNDDLATYIIREQIGAPTPITIGVVFLNHDGLVNIVAYQFLRINRPEMKQQVMELVNTLNVAYTFIKYTVKDDLVTAHISAPFMDNFNAELLNQLILSLLNALKQDYPRFMELLTP
jgi:hypothetical protein